MAIGPRGSRFRTFGSFQAYGVKRPAKLVTSLTGANNDLTFTSKQRGRVANTISVRYVDPSANDASLSVSVSGRAITVNLATGEAGAITSTAAQVKTAIEGSAAASALVGVALAPSNSGAGVVTALAATKLAGGRGFTVA